MELLKALFENAELPTDFKEKTTALFEAAVDEKVKADLVALQESFDSKIEETKQTMISESVDAIDAVFEETILEWAKENAQALDSSTKGQLAESFLVDLKALFEKADVEFSGDAAGIEVSKLHEQNTVLANEASGLAILLKEATDNLTKMKVASIIEKMTIGLADTQAHRVAKLCEAFEFKTEDDFRSKALMVLEAVAGIKGTFNADGTIVAVTSVGKGQTQADTASGTAGPEGGELVNKPAGNKVKSAEGDKGDPDSTQKALKEALQRKIDAVAPYHGSNLVTEALKLYK